LLVVVVVFLLGFATVGKPAFVFFAFFTWDNVSWFFSYFLFFDKSMQTIEKHMFFLENKTNLLQGCSWCDVVWENLTEIVCAWPAW
jgi:hypothetical protein